MVRTDGEGMEETDGEVLDLIAVRCCLLMVHQCHHASLSPRRCIPGHVVVILCRCHWLVVVPSCVSTRWVGGRWDRGYLPSINNDKQRMSFIILVAMSLLATWHLHSLLATGGRFHLAAVVSIHGWSFPSVGGCFHLWAVVCICSWSFSFMAVVFICLCLWPVICVRSQSVSMYIVVGGGRHVVVVMGSIVLWSLWWLMEEKKNVTCCDIRMMFKLTHEIT